MNFLTITTVKWTILVGLNAVISYIFAVNNGINSLDEHIAMVLGIFTWILIYVYAELYLYRNNLHRWRNSMTISAILKCFTQFYPIIEIFIGTLSLSFVEYTFEFFSGFFSVNILNSAVQIYFTTLVDGFLLTILVSILTLIVYLIISVFNTVRNEIK